MIYVPSVWKPTTTLHWSVGRPAKHWFWVNTLCVRNNINACLRPNLSKCPRSLGQTDRGRENGAYDLSLEPRGTTLANGTPITRGIIHWDNRNTNIGHILHSASCHSIIHWQGKRTLLVNIWWIRMHIVAHPGMRLDAQMDRNCINLLASQCMRLVNTRWKLNWRSAIKASNCLNLQLPQEAGMQCQRAERKRMIE